MKWENNGELAQRDLSELVRRLLDVEATNHGDELTRLGTKCNEEEWILLLALALFGEISHLQFKAIEMNEKKNASLGK